MSNFLYISDKQVNESHKLYMKIALIEHLRLSGSVMLDLSSIQCSRNVCFSSCSRLIGGNMECLKQTSSPH